VLYRCQHHLYPEKYSYEVLLQDSNVGIVCHSKSDKKTWRQRISLFLVSSFIQRYYYSMSTLWDLLAHSITFIGSEMKFSTQHIVNFHTRKTSRHEEAYIIWQVIHVQPNLALQFALIVMYDAVGAEIKRNITRGDLVCGVLVGVQRCIYLGNVHTKSSWGRTQVSLYRVD